MQCADPIILSFLSKSLLPNLPKKPLHHKVLNFLAVPPKFLSTLPIDESDESDSNDSDSNNSDSNDSDTESDELESSDSDSIPEIGSDIEE